MNILIGILIAIVAFMGLVLMTILSIVGSILSYVLMVIGLPILLAIAYITRDDK